MYGCMDIGDEQVMRRVLLLFLDSTRRRRTRRLPAGASVRGADGQERHDGCDPGLGQEAGETPPAGTAGLGTAAWDRRAGARGGEWLRLGGVHGYVVVQEGVHGGVRRVCLSVCLFMCVCVCMCVFVCVCVCVMYVM